MKKILLILVMISGVFLNYTYIFSMHNSNSQNMKIRKAWEMLDISGSPEKFIWFYKNALQNYDTSFFNQLEPYFKEIGCHNYIFQSKLKIGIYRDIINGFKDSDYNFTSSIQRLDRKAQYIFENTINLILEKEMTHCCVY